MMTYDQAVSLIGDLHRGSNTPDNLALVMKLVLGKIARLKVKSAQRTAEITVAGETTFSIADNVPDFLDFKLDAENRNKGPYYLQDTIPHYFTVTNNSRFLDATQGGFCTREGQNIKFSFPSGISDITKIYIPIYSKYLVLDAEGEILKETPAEGGDTFLFDSVFDDVFIDGVLLYLDRRDMDDTEFIKSKAEWTRALNELAYYQ